VFVWLTISLAPQPVKKCWSSHEQPAGAISAKVDPSKMAECVSWPQACMIRYLLERGNLVFLGKRQTEFVIAIIST